MAKFSLTHFTIITMMICASKVLATDWWENGNFYQIYPRSFQDSNGDGVGDLNGITSRMEYLKELGVSGVWLSPIFQSPMVDFGYDISDFRKIHSEYGTLADFDRLAAHCNQLGIKLILDFVPNHTSDKHEWFLKSIKNDTIYRDYYVWHPGVVHANGTRSPPSNWKSIFRFGAWTWVEERKEYYLHQFLKEQPDLNYRNPKVVQEMKDILSFWLDRGVAGFRCDAVPFIFETLPVDGNYVDEPPGPCEDPDDYCSLTHTQTMDRDETYDMIYQWYELLDDYAKANGGDTRILMTEAYTTLDMTIKYYGNGTRNGAQIPFNFELISYTNVNSTADDFKKNIDAWLNKVPNGKIANWVLGNHDNRRIASRYGIHRADAINILLKTLPGITVTYYGEELALTDVFLSYEETIDPAGCNNAINYDKTSRDPARTPMQWDASKNSGFSLAAKTWLPVAANYTANNVELQKAQNSSHLKIFKKLIQLRENPSMSNGTFESTVLGDLLLYKRELVGHDVFVIVINFGSSTTKIDLTKYYPKLTADVEVIIASLQSPLVPGDLIDAKTIELQSGVGLVLVAR